jgi:hypothetical protein
MRRPKNGDGRNNFLYRYAVFWYSLSRDPTTTERWANFLNGQFGQLLSENEVKAVVHSACKELTHFNGKTMPRRFTTGNTIGVLAITEEEQRRMRVLIGPNEKRRRDRERKAELRRSQGIKSREERRQETLQRVLEAIQRHPDATNTELGRHLRLTRQTVSNYRNQITVLTANLQIQEM